MDGKGRTSARKEGTLDLTTVHAFQARLLPVSNASVGHRQVQHCQDIGICRTCRLYYFHIFGLALRHPVDDSTHGTYGVATEKVRRALDTFMNASSDQSGYPAWSWQGDGC